MPFWTYMLHCRGGKFYTGQTDDLDHRIAQHQSGAIAGWTSERLPVELVWSQEFVSRYEALTAEKQIKGWSRAKKMALIRGNWELISSLAKSKSDASTSSAQTGKGKLADIVVTRAALDHMIEFALEAHPAECCGLMLGRDDAVQTVHPAANTHPTPETHFEIDPAALVAAHRNAREGGPEIIGYYHSHPNGLASPSKTDAKTASGDGHIWAIIADGEAAFWRDTPEGFVPLSYKAVTQ